MHHRERTVAVAVTAAALAGALSLAGPATASSAGPSGHRSIAPRSASCASGGGRHATTTVTCSAVRLDDTAGWQGQDTVSAAAAPPVGYGPAELQQAYNLTAAGAEDGKGKTVAIVDADDDPNALSDLSRYRSAWGLPPICGDSASRGCITFTKVNQKGLTGPLPAPDAGWSQEISVDLDTVSAICPNCNILLVESNSATLGSLARAEDTAATFDPVSIGNSYGVAESSDEAAYDADYNHSGIAVTAAAGDNGYGVQYPAASPDVIAVGGTTLTPAHGTVRGWNETAWSGDGSGCSAVEPQPSWQSKAPAITAKCRDRAVADVAAVADPDTGVAVYDSYGLSGWNVFGGTSVSAQIISALYALAPASGGTSPAALYRASSKDFYDVTAGSDGTCGSDLCTAGVGWDGPTGWGTPDGTAAF